LEEAGGLLGDHGGVGEVRRQPLGEAAVEAEGELL